jgi:exosome complex protein LRP1
VGTLLLIPVSVFNTRFTGTTTVDKAAAARFITHAITQASYGAQAADETPGAGPSSSMQPAAEPYMPKVTAKMVERAEWEREVREKMEDEEEGAHDALEVFDEDKEGVGEVSKGKGKEVVVEDGADADAAARKRRRGAADFFDGASLSLFPTSRLSHDSFKDASSSAMLPATPAEPASEPPKKKKKKKAAEAKTPNGVVTSESPKKSKKKSKQPSSG